eukprot:5445695-Amphidinium_carterae.1
MKVFARPGLDLVLFYWGFSDKRPRGGIFCNDAFPPGMQCSVNEDLFRRLGGFGDVEVLTLKLIS